MVDSGEQGTADERQLKSAGSTEPNTTTDSAVSRSDEQSTRDPAKRPETFGEFVRFHWPLFVVSFAALLLCLQMALNVPHWKAIDSYYYITLSERFLDEGKLESITRTPGLPGSLALFHSLFGDNSLDRFAQFQQILAFTRVPCLYWIFWCATRRRWAAALAGVIPLFVWETWTYDAAIMTESLFATGLCWLLVLGPAAIQKRTLRTAFAAAIVLTLLMLVRPVISQFGFLTGGALLLIAFRRFRRGTEWKSWLRTGIVLAFLPSALLLPFSVNNLVRYGYFNMSLMGPFAMAQRTGERFEDAPDEYAEIRDLYLQYKHQRGTHVGAFHDLMNAQKKEFGGQSAEETRHLASLVKATKPIHRYLILHDPFWLAVRSIQGMEMTAWWSSHPIEKDSDVFFTWLDGGSLSGRCLRLGDFVLGEHRFRRILLAYLLPLACLYLAFRAGRKDAIWVVVPFLTCFYLVFVTATIIPESRGRYRFPVTGFMASLGAVAAAMLVAQSLIFVMKSFRDKRSLRQRLLAIGRIVAVAAGIWVFVGFGWNEALANRSVLLTRVAQNTYGEFSLPDFNASKGRINLDSFSRQVDTKRVLENDGYFYSWGRPEEIASVPMEMATGTYRFAVHVSQTARSRNRAKVAMEIQDAESGQVLKKFPEKFVHGEATTICGFGAWNCSAQKPVRMVVSWGQAGPAPGAKGPDRLAGIRVSRIEFARLGLAKSPDTRH